MNSSLRSASIIVERSDDENYRVEIKGPGGEALKSTFSHENEVQSLLQELEDWLLEWERLYSQNGNYAGTAQKRTEEKIRQEISHSLKNLGAG